MAFSQPWLTPVTCAEPALAYRRLKRLESAPHANNPKTTLRSIRDMLVQTCGTGQGTPEPDADPGAHPDTAGSATGATGGVHAPQRGGAARSLMRRLSARVLRPD